MSCSCQDISAWMRSYVYMIHVWYKSWLCKALSAHRYVSVHVIGSWCNIDLYCVLWFGKPRLLIANQRVAFFCSSQLHNSFIISPRVSSNYSCDWLLLLMFAVIFLVKCQLAWNLCEWSIQSVFFDWFVFCVGFSSYFIMGRVSKRLSSSRISLEKARSCMKVVLPSASVASVSIQANGGRNSKKS